LMAARDGPQPFGQGKGEHKVGHRQEQIVLAFQPTISLLALTRDNADCLPSITAQCRNICSDLRRNLEQIR